MTIATLNRMTGRLVKAFADIERNNQKIERAGKRIGRTAISLLAEMARPNDKQLDALAKFYEAVNLWMSVVADFADDADDTLKELVRIVKQRRNDGGYYTHAQLESAFRKSVKRKRGDESGESNDAPLN